VYNFSELGKMLEIKSAVCLDHLKGFIYVEAFKDSHVSADRRGVCVAVGQWCSWWGKGGGGAHAAACLGGGEGEGLCVWG
jgi:hypothetical protein